MKVLKVYTDFTLDMSELGDAERGRLFTAMLQYAETGKEPQLKGNERILWGTAKKSIDSQLKSYSEMCGTNKRIATERNEPSRSVKESNEPSEEQEQEKEQEEEQEVNIPPYKPPKSGTAASIKQAFAEFAAGDEELLNALNEFADMRKKIKAPLVSMEAVNRLLNKLQREFPQEQWVAVLQQSVDRCWKGVFPLHTDTQKRTQRKSTNPFLDMLKEEQACEQL